MKSKTLSNLSYFVGLTAIAISITPIPDNYKVVTSLTGLVVSSHVAIADITSRKKKLCHTKKIKQDLVFLSLDLEAKQNALESDLDAVLVLKQETVQEKRELAGVLREIEVSALVEIEERERQANLRIGKARSALAAKMRSLKSRYWRRREQADLNNEFLLTAGWQEQEELFSHLSNKRRAEAAFKMDQLVQNETQGASQATQLLKDLILENQKAIKELSQRVVEDHQNDFEQGEKTLYALIDEIKQTSQAEAIAIASQFSALVATEFVLIQYLYQAALEELEELRGKLYAESSPVYCPNTSRAGEKANEFIRFVDKELKVKLTWLSSLFLSDDCLQVDFGFVDCESKAKAIAKLQKPQAIEALGVRFGTEGLIIIANPTDHCWRATIPANQGYKGCDEVYEVTGCSAITLTGCSAIAQDLSQELQRKMSYDAISSYMTDFVPVTPISRPKAIEPSNQELTTLSWFAFWRNDSTGQANIVTTEGLLKAVYGLNDYEFDSINPDWRESPRARVERVLAIARTNYGELLLNG